MHNRSMIEHRLRAFLVPDRVDRSHPEILLADSKGDLQVAPDAGPESGPTAGDVKGETSEQPAVAQSTDQTPADADSGSQAADQKDELLLEDGGQAAQQSDDLLLDTGEGRQDDLLLDDTLSDTEQAEAAPAPEKKKAKAKTDSDEEHAKLFAESRYPSATTCATCHPKHYEEWSVSSHAYAQLSPVYMAMQIAINMKTSSTTGDFCIRCHNQVGMNLGESIFASNLDRNPTSREGITCTVCHRLNQDYGKVSGRFALEQGDIYAPIYGPSGGRELNRVLKSSDFNVSTSSKDPGRAIHGKAKKFAALTTPHFCGSCHDVNLPNGFRLEEAFAEWQRSPAAKRGETCQDCHMGKVQGVASGYERGPAAIVGEVPTKNRKLTNHFFAGPDYSIIHPGLFPHNVEAAELKTMREWLQFNYKAGWGTDKFEDAVPKGYKFPKAWKSPDERYDAREILNTQFKRLKTAEKLRREVLQNGFKLSKIKVARAGRRGIDFSIDVKNGTDGHGVPTGFDAERLIFLQVTVRDPKGRVVYKSGDRDPNGDVRDAHSLYVHNGELPLDEDLFNMQSKFIVRLIRGGEREQVLAVNTSAAVLPFVRPERRAATIYGRPRGSRKHKKTIEPLGSRTAKYKVDADELTTGGVYTISVKLIAQMVPVNLIAAIQIAGFDYNMSPKGIADAVVDGAMVVHTRRAKVRID
ncbi:MAG: multiheme c-type cytochrome [Hyphomicrobiales bacterium]